jgi:heme-degrading monooxygenase HmoA
MAVLVTADVPGQTQDKYDQMLAVLEPMLREARGFIAHGAGPAGDRWRTFEIWETQEDATQFFAKYIHPNLPPGIKPQRTLLELHSLVQAE